MDKIRQYRFLIRGESLQKPVRRFSVGRRASDPDAQTPEPPFAQVLFHGADSVVAPVAAAEGELHRTERSLHVIVNHQNLSRGDGKKGGRCLNAAPILVHERFRYQQGSFRGADKASIKLLFPGKARLHHPGKEFRGFPHETARVVPCPGVPVTGISKKCDQAQLCHLRIGALHSRYTIMLLPGRVVVSEKTDPWFNLAMENWIFRDLPRDEHVLFLWRNDPSVVIGRHQNPWVECDLAHMRRDGVVLARRQSGGGAVYHDHGNVNFSFISPASEYSKDRNFAVVLEALEASGVPATRSRRNDILVADGATNTRKISGSAFKHTRERCFHHGTLLLDADLERLHRYLTPVSQRLKAKGTRSVPWPVINLRQIRRDLTYQGLFQALIDAFTGRHGMDAVPVHREGEDMSAFNPDFDAYHRTMGEWEWLYGMTPEFVHTVRNLPGTETLNLVVHGGLIERVEPEEGCVSGSRDVSRTLIAALKGVRYEKTDIIDALEGALVKSVISAVVAEIP